MDAVVNGNGDIPEMKGHVASSGALSKAGCDMCERHLATIQTMSEVSHQQSIVLKEQQASIAALIQQNAAYQQMVLQKQVFGNINATPPRQTAAPSTPVNKVVGNNRRPNPGITKKSTPATKPAAAKPKSASKGSPSPLAAQLMQKRGRGRPSKTSSKAMEPLSASAEDGEDVQEDATAVAEVETPGIQRVEKEKSGGDDDAIEVTRIWITATPAPKTRCPLPECDKRNFAAADMYHFKRHFLQIHKHTHPNPEFIFQCPVEDCSVEFEGSLKNAKDHMRSEHKELFPESPTKSGGGKKSRPKKGAAPVEEGEAEQIHEEELPTNPEDQETAAEEPNLDDITMEE